MSTIWNENGDVINEKYPDYINYQCNSTQCCKEGRCVFIEIKKDNAEMNCPLCGSENYEETEELMYENGNDDPQYGGELKIVKYGDCRDCG
jgi:hypothetical protein